MMRSILLATAIFGAGLSTAAWAQAAPPTAKARCEVLASRDKIQKPDRPSALAACTEAQATRPDDARLLYLKGRALFWSEKDSEAFAAYTAAARGYAPAVRELGVMHHWGYSVPENPAKAIELYRQALAGGDAQAAINLGYVYRQGAGAPKNPELAARYYRQAAEAGLAAGELGLGYAYDAGLGVPKDLARVVELYRRAAEKGDPSAQHNLGFMAAQGRGLPKDPAEALRWYRMSAAGGGSDGMFALGLAYNSGSLGLAQDTAEAERWFRKSIEAGDEVGAPNTLAYLLLRENRNLGEAATLAEGAHKAAPEDAAVMDTLALARLRQKRFGEAALLARKSIAAEPTPIHMARLGDIYAAMGLKAEARDQWRRALDVAQKPGADTELPVADLRRRLASID
jgi:TPR repeat protein